MISICFWTENCSYCVFKKFVTFANMKKDRKVIHLEFEGNHYYFGSLKAMCDDFGADKLKLSYSTIRNMRISPETPFVHPRLGYIIREGILKASSISNNNFEF